MVCNICHIRNERIRSGRNLKALLLTSRIFADLEDSDVCEIGDVVKKLQEQYLGNNEQSENTTYVFYNGKDAYIFQNKGIKIVEGVDFEELFATHIAHPNVVLIRPDHEHGKCLYNQGYTTIDKIV
ncbi:MAG: hypothetical protein ACMXYG_05305 [Candidatus Woesearchaeota archaeon]